MSSTAILLLVLSAITHAGWNFLGKRQNPSTAYFLLANTMGCLVVAPVALVYVDAWPMFVSTIWLALVMTGIFQAVYLGALAAAYRAGDMSVAYPLARSSPIIVVTTVTWILGQGEAVSRLCVAGIVFVVAGCFLVPMRRFREFRLANYVNVSCLFALLAACGTAGYTIVDDAALRALRNSSDWPLNTFETAFIYLVFESIVCSVFLALFAARTRAGRSEIVRIARTRLRGVTLMGLGIILTYGLVLASMAFASNVSYVSAFRQLSIPLGAVLGVTLLKEPRYVPKFVGVLVMFAGLVLVALG